MPPGILYVTMGPKPSLPAVQFHDWYNNEHGPGRLRYPKIFNNGFRYRATDSLEPEWMAIYDVTDMALMTQEPYINLRKAPLQSQRERDTMKEIKVDRRVYDLEDEFTLPDGRFKTLEKVENEGEGNVLIAVYLKPRKGRKEEVDKWYREEHVEMLQKVPGWLRTRRFVTATVDEGQEEWLVSLHEYKPQNGLGGPEFQAAVSTPWALEILGANGAVEEKERRTYELVYTFGPAPRDNLNLTTPFTSYDGLTREYPEEKAIESYVTTPDGIKLHYRLEGSTKPDAPVIVLSNSILVDWGVWDGFVSAFGSDYRIVRYLPRGRSSDYGDQKITIDLLGEDVIALLDALKVKTAACVIGVSMGGATALNVGLKYPTRVASFISCDTSASSPAGNSKAWGERIAIAEKEAATTEAGEALVGEELAEATTRRWFPAPSYDGGKLEAKIGRVKSMVSSNSLEGFKKSVEALYEYDMRDLMGAYEGNGLFVVGGSDGALPKSMKAMAETLGKQGADLKVLEGAGHLPMVEKPEEFAEIVKAFLST